jgi:hypothetical protein
MARQIESNLYKNLIESEFSFVERGTRPICEIYESVKNRFPDLCDDTYLCCENCKSNARQPEWHHTVRGALQRLKSVNGTVVKAVNTGFWEFR